MDGFKTYDLNNVLNVKALVGAFNQEKALVGAFSVIAKSSGTFGKPSFEALLSTQLGTFLDLEQNTELSDGKDDITE